MTEMEKLLEKLATQLNVNLNALGKSRPPETPNKPPVTVSSRWNPANLGYFNLHLDKLYPKGNIIAINKETWICNMHLFVARIKDLVLLKSG